MEDRSAYPRRDQRAYDLAMEYLLGFGEVTREILERHLSVLASQQPKTLADVYKQLLSTAQNAGMMPGVIGAPLGTIESLAVVLCDFQPTPVVEKYAQSWGELLDAIESTIKPRGRIRRTPKSIWPRFCRAALSGAAFLSQFKTLEDFQQRIELFNQDERVRPALPLLLSAEIDGIGFPLACDFLKELGYVDYGKPDVHLKKIFVELKLSSDEADLTVFKAIVRVARNVGVTPYNVDKLFWLTGSGKFYHDNVRIGRHRDEFIEFARQRLDL